MSVKKKDRHISQSEALQKSRVLAHQALIITHAREYDSDGKQIRKPGILAEGQPFYAFGNDILQLSKKIHAKCYEALQIKINDDEESLRTRTNLHKEAIECCKSILRLMDLCIYEYGSAKKRRKSFVYISRLAYDTMKSLQDRINRDSLIFQHKYNIPHHHRRGR